MKVYEELKGGILNVSLAGELDHHAAKEAMRMIAGTIETELPGGCVLDMRKVDFMDSSGIALILNVNKRICSIGGRLRIENVPGQPMKVLRASGIEGLLNIKELRA